jgi:hypothetical protein
MDQHQQAGSRGPACSLAQRLRVTVRRCGTLPGATGQTSRPSWRTRPERLQDSRAALRPPPRQGCIRQPPASAACKWLRSRPDPCPGAAVCQPELRRLASSRAVADATDDAAPRPRDRHAPARPLCAKEPRGFKTRDAASAETERPSATVRTGIAFALPPSFPARSDWRPLDHPGCRRRASAPPRLRSPARARQRTRRITEAGPARSGGLPPEIRHLRDPPPHRLPRRRK